MKKPQPIINLNPDELKDKNKIWIQSENDLAFNM